MDGTDRLKLAREAYEAYESGDRSVIERLMSEDLVFYSPADVGIDRARYFERCWPNADLIEDGRGERSRRRGFEFKRLVEIGENEVLVTYESTKTDGSRFRNTEVLTFRDEEICQVEVSTSVGRWSERVSQRSIMHVM